jgi:hypothetical protein
MLNDPQDSNNSSPFYAEEPVVMTTETDQKPTRREGLLFGMTAIQRFVVMLLIFFLTCVLGSMCLLLTGKVVLF